MITDTLQIKRESLVRTMEEIVEAAESANRPMTDDEQKRFDEASKEIKTLDGSLTRSAELDQLRSAAAPQVWPGGFNPNDPIPGREHRTAGYHPGNGNVTHERPIYDESGRCCRALRPDETFRSLAPDPGDLAGVGIGDMFRALAIGPRNELEKRALSEGTNSAGGYTVPSITAVPWFDLLRAQSYTMRAGMQVFPLTTNSTTVATVASDPGLDWRAENEQISESDPTIGSVTFVPETCAAYIRVSRELLEDSVNINDMLATMLAKAFAAELDRVVLVLKQANRR